jgi:hypothetical protein
MLLSIVNMRVDAENRTNTVRQPTRRNLDKIILTSPVWLNSCSFSFAGFVYDFPHPSQVQMYHDGVRPGVGNDPAAAASFAGDDVGENLLDEANAFSASSYILKPEGCEASNICSRGLEVIIGE